ncbi:hypothetical protein [Geopsychrobacter electrodiphilus]|uniref:hypothetical protein n=1 Tax=Geopsychrobacter electrodiphilus TaxID=225196 RepID=UPI00035CFD38|nr:hypothetical protein [Geopsychrobacter electrodiphilus]
MNRLHKQGLALLIILLLTACSHYVTELVPPVIDLRNYKTVAVVDFPVSASFPAQAEVTRRFLAALQAAQPGVKILELGSAQQVLTTIGRTSFDIGAIKMIGQQYGVDAVLTGEMTVTVMQPSLSLNNALTQLSASAKVKGALNSKVRETSNGATAWTNGAHGTWTLAGFSMDEHGLTGGRVNDVNSKYEEMLSDLVNVATRDFRPTYKRRQVD